MANSESDVWSESASCGDRMPSAVTASMRAGAGTNRSEVSAPER